MIETPHITDSQAQRVACIPLTVSRTEIQHVMGPAISEVYGTLAAQGIAPSGPWFTFHKQRPTDVFDFEACVPVAAPVAASGRVKPGELAARARVARTVYHGGYEGLGGAWGEFIQWVEANGHKPAQDLWECYVVGPESSQDPANWRTELNLPLLDA
ncbi:GyrI-like domain-containing protein [Uliginosibacterium sp. H3]|uniref:GyrI-like domain-containing protein n=1 Tax=Uliginosibacterium silvisoli TaxID=3114758 RepID=A0ABU6K698_9RHOO|nr:GyrI-like domain-containing protein [Uliginosibacterium sp. H3]